MEQQRPPADLEALVQNAYEAFNSRDIDAALWLMHPDVEWPNGMEGGYMHGREAVRRYWTRQWELIDPSVDPQRLVMEPDGRIAVDVHQVIRDISGKVVADQMVQHVYRLGDGLIEHMEIRPA